MEAARIRRRPGAGGAGAATRQDGGQRQGEGRGQRDRRPQREPRPGRVRKQVHANETPHLGSGFHGGYRSSAE